MLVATETITLFNRGKKDTWHGTVIKGVTWLGGKPSALQGTAMQEEHSITVRIPEEADTGSKAYATPGEWRRMLDEEAFATDYWTLQNGDIIIRGEVAEELVEDGMPEVLASGAPVITIVTWADNRHPTFSSTLRHWKAVGR